MVQIDRLAWLALLASLAGLLACGPGEVRDPVSALRVLDTEPGSSAARAGLLPGDLLVAWRGAGGEGGPLATVPDLDLLRAERSWSGPVELTASRQGETLDLTLVPGEWGLEVAGPRPFEDVLGGSFENADAEAFRAALNAVAPAVEPTSWAWQARGEALLDGARYTEAAEAFAAAAALAEPAGGAANTGARRGWLLHHQALALLRSTDLDAAEPLFEAALRLFEAAVPASPSGSSQGGVGAAEARRGLGKIALNRDRFAEAGRHLERALALADAADPQGRLAATVRYDLGQLATRRGELGKAEARYGEALAAFDRLGVADVAAGALRMGLGIVAFERGNLARAEALYREALALFETEAPGSPFHAWALQNLGNVAGERGELARAEELHGRSLAIREAIRPDGLDVAMTLQNLGALASLSGDVEEARRRFLRGLAIVERTIPESVYAAQIEENLGHLEAGRGDLEAAEAHYRRALERYRALVPGGLLEARAAAGLAEAAEAGGRLGEAETLWRRVLTIRGRLAPASREEAETLHALGMLSANAGRRTEALDLLRRAVDALEAQQGKLGGSAEARSRYRARVRPMYQDLMDLLLEAGHPEEAFGVLERARARGLLELLAERDLVPGEELPAELEAKRRRLAHAYDALQAGLGELSPERDAPAVEEALEERARLREEQQALREEIRRRSPRLAALRDPRPLGVEEARALLEPGEALLAFDVGPGRTHLFALVGGRLRTATLPVAEEALREEVRAFREGVAAGGGGAQDVAAVRRRAAALYRRLLAPAEPWFEEAERLLLVPDGPLHALPWAALVRPGPDQSEPGRWLAEWKPLRTSLSMTVYAQLAGAGESPRGSETARLVAFGDPDLSAEPSSSGDAVLRSAVHRGLRLTALPGSRQEVLSLAALWGKGARGFVGAEATEERAKGVGRSARYLHFATHAFLDSRFPLDSGLVLALPEAAGNGRENGRENGLLQAWEIFEQVRLDADLVTLSACESGLGEELEGEGLIGLARAFQYAGARSVVASLWQVGDRSTAALMEAFYRHLAAGEPKDEALRAAQLELIRGTGPGIGQGPGGPRRAVGGLVGAGKGDPEAPAGHPFHWAAFQLIGAR